MNANSLARTATVALVAMLTPIPGGCSRRPDPGESTEVGVRTIDRAGYAELLERSRGNVLLVDFWATWCGPCMELFPHTVELHKRYADRGLTVVSVSLDDPDTSLPQVLQFLTEQNAAFANFISQYGTGTDSTEVFELDGPLPQMKLFDRQGKLYQSFGGADGSVDTAQLDRALEELLGDR